MGARETTRISLPYVERHYGAAIRDRHGDGNCAVIRRRNAAVGGHAVEEGRARRHRRRRRAAGEPPLPQLPNGRMNLKEGRSLGSYVNHANAAD